MIPYLTNRFYTAAAIEAFLFVLGYLWTPVYVLALVLFGVWMLLTLADLVMLYAVRPSKMTAERQCADRFSNGDANDVAIILTSPYAFWTHVEVIDEAPVDFQMRDFVLRGRAEAFEQRSLLYKLTPTHRGSFHFDRIRIFFATPIGFFQRRFTRGTPFDVKVYPSFAHLSLYSLICNHRLDQYGVKRVRQVGADTDFEQIKDYFEGDEYRHINWKASARANTLKVNVYQQDRSMPVYSVIDKGRMMQQSAFGLTFLEYAINASLALSYVAVKKDDQAGVAAFSDTVDAFVPANKQGSQMQKLMEALYAQQTIFAESDYSALATLFAQRITKRSFVMLFANFATLNALDRELPYLGQIARSHQLVVVIFRDREMEEFIHREPRNTEEYYQQISVEKYYGEKQKIIKKLCQFNILTLYTLPEHLSVSVINRYLELRRF